MVGRPPPAGPKTVRELFHYVYRWLTSIYDETAGAVSASHPAVTVTDTATVDLTISGGQILSGIVVPNSIGYTELDATVEADIAAAINVGRFAGSQWTYRGVSGDVDPGAGNFKTNNATLSSVTEIYIDDENDNGVDVSTILSLMAAGGRLYVQEHDDATKSALFSLTTITDNATYFKLVIVHLDSGTGGNLTTNKNTVLMYSGGSSSSGHTIKENGVALPPQVGLNFNGTRFDLADSAPNTNVDLSVAAVASLAKADTAIQQAAGTMANPPYSVVIDEPTTNLCVNPKFEVNVTDGWSLIGTGTRARNTTEKFLGNASMQVGVTAANDGVLMANVAVAINTTYVFSCWLKGAAGGEPIKQTIQGSNSAVTGANSGLDATQVITNSWKRYRWFHTTNALDTFIQCRLQSHTAGAATFYVSGVQVERADLSPNGEAVPSAYCDGDMGDGHAWTGTANNSTSTRTGKFHLLADLVANPSVGGFIMRPDGSIGGKMTFRTDLGNFGKWNAPQDEPVFPYEFIGDFVTQNKVGVRAAVMRLENTANGTAVWIKSGATVDIGMILEVGSLTSGTGLGIFAPDSVGFPAMISGLGKFLDFADKSGNSAYSYFVEKQVQANPQWDYNMAHQMYGGGTIDPLVAWSAAVGGTMQLTSGSPNVVGVGANFLTNLRVGDEFQIESGTPGVWFATVFYVLSITDQNNLVMTANSAVNATRIWRKNATRKYQPPKYIMEVAWANHKASLGGQNVSIYASGLTGQLHVVPSATRDVPAVITGDDQGDPLVTVKYERASSTTTLFQVVEVSMISGYTIPARLMQVAGKRLRGHFAGVLTSGSTAHTITLRFKLNGTTIFTSVVRNMPAAASYGMVGDFEIVFVTDTTCHLSYAIQARSRTTADVYHDIDIGTALACDFRRNQTFEMTAQVNNVGSAFSIELVSLEIL